MVSSVPPFQPGGFGAFGGIEGYNNGYFIFSPFPSKFPAWNVPFPLG